MNPLLSAVMTLGGRWGVGLAGWALVSAMIWTLFPLVPALAEPGPRLAAIGLALAIYLGLNAWLSWRKHQRERALAATMAGDDADRTRDGEGAEEVAQLRARMREALDRLRAGRRGRHLYDQPWYVIIGPPGSGKTTALRNSGLQFPLPEAAAVGGVGGTRLCDWWFADEAVLIDTAGRYTTQDSDTVVDKAGWLGFLDLLRHTRPRQPLNGVLVVLSLLDLAVAPPAEREAHAVAVRQRIDELTDRLQLRLPTYVVLSKADQLRGFDAYFDDLDPAGRAQVWGATFKLDEGAEAFAREFRLLLAQLDQRLIERLQAERAAERRALIGNFPLQVASLEQPLTEFVSRAFAGTRRSPAPLLRGVYITSATQQGTPIDRLTGLLAQTFGVNQKRVAALRPVSGRSYFLAKLLKDVVLGEALLVSRPPRLARRRRLWRMTGFAAVAVATVLGGAALWHASAANRVAVEVDDERLAGFAQRLAQMRLDPVTTDDLPSINTLLNAAGAEAPPPAGGLPALYGLNQAAKLRQADRIVYRRALERILLPRLIWRLEAQMRERIGNPDRLYDATRVYLMLTGAGPLSPDVVQAWLEADWDARFPGALNAALRHDLAAHLSALLAEPLPPVAADGALVETARAAFSRVSVAARVYGRFQGMAAQRRVPDWTPAAALSDAGTRMFARRSGEPLTEGVPGFFTGRGFREVLVANLSAATHAVAAESWVLGHAAQIPAEGAPVVALEQDVIALYTADAQARWDAMLNDLVLAGPGRTVSVQELYVLSSPQSPLRDMLLSIAQALRLVEPPRPAADGKPAAPRPPSPAVQRFEAHYQALFDLAGSPLDNILRLINALQQELSALAPGSTSMPATLQSSGGPVPLLEAEASRQPPPLSGWLRQIAAAGSAMLGSATHAVASNAFAAGDGPQALCQRVVTGHYPFDPQGQDDAQINDFVRLFAPGGALDTYFQTQLKPFVDTRGAIWRTHFLGGVAAPVDASSIAAFQRGAVIRDAFFPAAGPPQVRFSLLPSPGPGGQGTLIIGAVAITADATEPVQLTWPGSDGNGRISLHLGGDDVRARQFNGPWALFKLLDQATVTPRSATVFDVTFTSGGYQARFTLDAGTTPNPFGSNVLRGFQCPTVR